MKTGLLLITHGNAAAAMLVAAEGMLGPQEKVEALALEPGMGADDLSAAAAAALDSFGGQGLVLVDMLGGTPWNVAAALSLKHPGREVYAPLSLAVLLEALAMREGYAARDLARELKRRGLEAVAVLSELTGGAQAS